MKPYTTATWRLELLLRSYRRVRCITRVVAIARSICRGFPNNAHFPAVASPFEGEWSANPSRLCWGSSETLYIDAQSVRSTIPSKLTNGATETRVFKILHLNVAGQLALTVECDHEQRELKLVGDTVVGGFTGGVLHKCN